MTGRMQRWLDEHDPYFEHPCESLGAGISLGELAEAYERTFRDKRVAASHLARDLECYLLAGGQVRGATVPRWEPAFDDLCQVSGCSNTCLAGGNGRCENHAEVTA